MRRLLPLLLLAPFAAHAQASSLLVLGAGATDVLEGGARAAADLRLEYRAGLSLAPFTEPLLAVRPWVGIEGTSRGSVWGGAGILLDIPIGRFSLVPQAGVGGYEQGDGKDLGSPLEFRTGVELDYRCADGSRVGAEFTHMSNANVTRHNPGTEAVVVNYQFPLGWLTGR
jgi:lipid A 3-O-deacylase